MFRRLCRLALIPGNWLILILLLVCFHKLWSKVVFITLIPFWMWGIAGAGVCLLGWHYFQRNRLMLFSAILWLGVGLIKSDEAYLFSREISRKPIAETNSPSLRIVSVNCRLRSFDSVKFAAEQKPDVLFLQESPELSKLQPWIKQTFGEAASGVEGRNMVIIVKQGTLFDTDRSLIRPGVLSTRWELPDGETVSLTNLHLHRAFIHLRHVSPRLLHHLVHIRETNNYALQRLFKQPSPDKYQIVGGDFGTPPHDAIFRYTRAAGLIDTFPISGKGSGNTVKAKIPLFRIDQFWMTESLAPKLTKTALNPHTDHRMVICDFELK